MRKKYVGLGLLVALWIAGAAWSRQPATGAGERTTLAASDVFDADGVAGTDGHRRPGDIGSRRMLGLWGLATVGVLLVLRARRPLTI